MYKIKKQNMIMKKNKKIRAYNKTKFNQKHIKN